MSVIKFPMQKRMSILIIIISLFLIFVFASKIINEFNENKKIYTIKLGHGFGFSPEYILVPVKIGNEMYRFIIDTGASVSTVNSTLKNKPFFQLESDQVDISVIEPADTTLKYNRTKKIKFELGGKTLSHTFYYNAEKGADKMSDGILGMDLLNEFNWIFDVKNNEIKFSRQKLQANGQNQLKIDYELSDSGNPYFNILINNKLRTNVLFDTGYTSKVKMNNYVFLADFIVSRDMQGDSIMNFLYNEIDTTHIFRKLKERGNISFHISPKLNINGFAVDKFVTFQNNDSPEKNSRLMNEAKLTVQFLNRFDRLYLSPKKKECIFE